MHNLVQPRMVPKGDCPQKAGWLFIAVGFLLIQANIILSSRIEGCRGWPGLFPVPLVDFNPGGAGTEMRVSKVDFIRTKDWSTEGEL